MLGKEEVINKLIENNKSTCRPEDRLTLEGLKALLSELSVKPKEGANVLLLYSGPLKPNGRGGFETAKGKRLQAWQVAQKIGETYKNVGVIGQTDAMQVLDTPIFEKALEYAVGPSQVKPIINGTINPDGTRNPDGLNDIISRRFIEENPDKPIILLTPFSRPDSVFRLSELDEIIKGCGTESVEGLERNLLQKICKAKSGDTKHVNTIISTLSAEQALSLRYAIDEEGELVGVDASEFWHDMVREDGRKFELEGHTIVSHEDLMDRLNPEQRENLEQGIKVVEDGLNDATRTPRLKKFFNKAAPIASLVVGLLTGAFLINSGNHKPHTPKASIPRPKTIMGAIFIDASDGCRDDHIDKEVNNNGVSDSADKEAEQDCELGL